VTDRSSQSVYAAWLRYMNTVSSCVVQMFHSWTDYAQQWRHCY